ncbi:xylulokinase [Raineyella fluvialis]|uniref:Xylulose kinase n=1 Tax=Raineyella fluvialis TaxID=2662261 RepID=A0A5Q2FAW6_9ACTN|nr:xylulokinase [Raineyella fluvialis]QGF23848.1 xylulokinase [Raineyella fluvialis]
MTGRYVLGVDSSTQSCKSVLIEAETGRIEALQRAAHPRGTQVDPQAWRTALSASADGLLERAAAVGVGGQQHGMVALDAEGCVVRPAMLWNDTSSADAATRLVAELGGPQACADAVGSVMVASLTASKLRWLRDEEPENAARVASVMLPHDYLTWHLGGRAEMTTDHGDASGTGYYSTAERRFLPEIAELALGHRTDLPRIAAPNEVVGHTRHGAAISAGTGDNMAAALGMGLQPGDICLSIGTSGVASGVSERPVHDGSGLVTGFADATGRYLPLACTLNGARVLELGATMLGVDLDEFSRLALAGTPGAHGLVLLPYLDGERTPNRPHATGVFRGLTTATSREDIARAAVEGLLCSMWDAVLALRNATGMTAGRIFMIGGGSRSEAVRRIAPQVFGQEVALLADGEYVALGAARQALWALTGDDTPPDWPAPDATVHQGDATPAVHEQYAALRDDTEGWD